MTKGMGVVIVYKGGGSGWIMNSHKRMRRVASDIYIHELHSVLTFDVAFNFSI